MRISTSQFYFQNSQRLTNKQSDVNDQMKYISSGKRVLTAKDDAVSYGTLAGYKNELSSLEKYQRNITQANNRNNLQETSLANAETQLQAFKQLFIRANNGTLSELDMKSLAGLAADAQKQMLDIANSKDETGGFIFSGYQIDKEPFVLQPDNSVQYIGDSGLRELQIAKNVMVQTNQPGDIVFEDVSNPIGDFSPVYNTNASGLSVKSAKIATPASYDPVTNPPDYSFNFTSATNLTVTDSAANVVFSTGTYSPGQTIAFNGIEVEVSGNPLPGDTFDLTPEENISVFETLKSAVDWMNVGTSPSDPTQHKVNYGEILTEIDSALNHIISQRAEAGVRLNLIDSQMNKHKDTELTISTGKSEIEDLDFAKAVSTFEQSQVALQAAQQTFVQIKGLSLFNYI